MQKRESIIHSIDANQQKTPLSVALIVVISAVVMGGASGYFASRFIKNPLAGAFTGGLNAPANETAVAADGSVRSAGIKDQKVFTDSAEGMLREGGFEDEGSFHLERPGGKSQNVYLTSSTVDLSQFIGKRVKVMGKTFAAQKAGWLMDVGYIEVQ